MITLKKSPAIGSSLEDFQKPFHIIPLSSNLSQVSTVQSPCFEQTMKEKELSKADCEIHLMNKKDLINNQTCVDAETTAQPVLIKDSEDSRNIAAAALSVNANLKSTTCSVSRENIVNITQNKSHIEKSALAISKSQSPSKAEDTQNILLKQLLKNTSSNNVNTVPLTTSAISSVCNQSLSNRKIINVRAPSLGLVSSLEAQLARPVLPPVTETAANIHSPNSGSVEQKVKIKEDVEKAESENEMKLSEVIKQSHQKISKETSFVSNPKFISSNNTSKFTKKSTSLSNITFSNINISPSLNLPDISVEMYESSRANANSLPLETVYTKTYENKRNRETSTTNKSKFPTLINIKIGNKQNEMNASITQMNLQKPLDEENMSNDESNLQKEDNYNESINKKIKKEIDSFSEKNQKDCTVSSFKGSKAVGKLDNDVNKSSVATSSINSSIVTCTNNSETLHYSTCAQKFQGRNTGISKGIEKRKKRKREFYKHKRQFPNVKKEPTGLNDITNLKKRPRKCFKNEEDYDVFMDKTLFKIKQMPPLQVLEPFLCRNINVITMQNVNGLNKQIFSSEQVHGSSNTFSFGRFDSQRSIDLNFYDVHPFGEIVESPKTKNKLMMQNDFYDQEFFLEAGNNKKRKLDNLISIIKEKNVEYSDIISPAKNACNISQLYYPKWNCSLKTSFPGIAVINHDAEPMGRVSPVIPHVDPTQFHLKSLPVIQFKLLQNTFNNSSNVTKHLVDYNKEKNLTVILSIPSNKAANILSLLKKLANILQTSTISSFKFLDDVSINQKNLLRLKNKNNYVNIQNILNGSNKFCLGCKVTVTKKCIRTPQKDLKITKTSRIPTLIIPSKYHYFCSKACYDQCRYQDGFVIERSVKSSNKDFKSIENKRRLSLKKFKKCRFRYYTCNTFSINSCLGTDSKKLGNSLFFKYNFRANDVHNQSLRHQKGINLEKMLKDTRRCILCNQMKDGASDGTSRLLNYDVDLWVHLNCALWSNGVYETIGGGLMNVETAIQNGINQVCSSCQHLGATIKCFKNRCNNTFHLLCAKKEQCVFYKNKTVHCQAHASKSTKDNELISIEALRRIFVERDENRQVAAIMHHSDLNNLLRVGSLIFLNVGQLLPHQLEAFHTANNIYPIGYKAIRFYWSMNTPGVRCRYICSIAEVAGRPEFRVEIQDKNAFEISDSTPNAVWHRILEPIVAMRKKYQHMRIFPKFVSGDELFGLNEPAIVRILESLPGVETLTDYRFKYGRNPLLELPLAIHPSGAARTEPKQRQVLGLKKPHTQRSAATTNQRLSSSVVLGEIACPYSKQFVHSKSSQYKKMKQEWRNNVYLARSKIQGLGLYAARDVEKHTMVIEYIGEVIRTEVSEIREKNYELKNRGIYMFRLDEDRIVDATLSGGLARYINHSCNPNCVTEIVDVDRELRIIIFAKRRINRGEELSYDYKFDIEDDSNKLSCMCGAPNCRKWMN